MQEHPIDPEKSIPEGGVRPAGAEGSRKRRCPVGVEVTGLGEASARVWAPKARRVEVVTLRGGREIGTQLAPEGGGYFSGAIEAGPGALYAYRLDGAVRPLPDPTSRYQPQGVHGFSQVIDPAAFRWADRDLARPGAGAPGRL